MYCVAVPQKPSLLVDSTETHNSQPIKENLKPQSDLKENLNTQSDLTEKNILQQHLLENHKPWETTNLNLLKAAIRSVLDSFKYGILASNLQGKWTIFLYIQGSCRKFNNF